MYQYINYYIHGIYYLLLDILSYRQEYYKGRIYNQSLLYKYVNYRISIK